MSGRVSLIAHRGQPDLYPENSIEGFIHCLEAGARYVETDIHITADGIPILSHDANLLKLTGKQLIVSDHPFEKIRDIPSGFPERFGNQYENCRIASLAQFTELILQWPDVLCFIELKGSALDYFGNRAVDLTIEAMQPIMRQCIFISFEYDALVFSKEHYDLPLGWVLPEWSEETRLKAQELSPQYLLVDDKICPRQQSSIWPGNWTWVVYTINSANQVKHYQGIGIELIETNRYSDLIKESDVIEVSSDF